MTEGEILDLIECVRLAHPKDRNVWRVCEELEWKTITKPVVEQRTTIITECPKCAKRAEKGRQSARKRWDREKNNAKRTSEDIQ